MRYFLFTVAVVVEHSEVHHPGSLSAKQPQNVFLGGGFAAKYLFLFFNALVTGTFHYSGWINGLGDI